MRRSQAYAQQLEKTVQDMEQDIDELSVERDKFEQRLKELNQQ
jgi:prefoldin subunit 5